MPEEDFDQVELLEKSLPKEKKCLITYYPEWGHIYYDGDLEVVEKVKQEMMRGSSISQMFLISMFLNLLALIFIVILAFIV